MAPLPHMHPTSPKLGNNRPRVAEFACRPEKGSERTTSKRGPASPGIFCGGDNI